MHRGLPGITLGYCLLDDVHLTTILCLGTLSDYPSSGSSISIILWRSSRFLASCDRLSSDPPHHMIN
jgi:hypothetical protein